jgi:hypothetical protein
MVHAIPGLMRMFFAWLKQRREERALVESDAATMIETFGESAYLEARRWVIAELAHKVIDGDRPAGHWARVRAEVGKRIKHVFKSDTATRYLEGE